MQQDYKTLIIYVLTLFVVVLLIVLKKQQSIISEIVSIEVNSSRNWPPSGVGLALLGPLSQVRELGLASLDGWTGNEVSLFSLAMWQTVADFLGKCYAIGYLTYTDEVDQAV